MIVLATLLFLYWLVVHALFIWATAHWFNVYVTLLLACLYVPSYLDGKEYTGERHWRALREWRFWRRLNPVETCFFTKKDLDAVDHRSMRLYVMVPGKTLGALIWGIGLHGGTLNPFAERLHFVVPPLYLAIPLLRDVLMWMGAVTFHPRKLPLTDLTLKLLQSNRSVCYCPSSFLSATKATASGSGAQICMDMELFEFALRHHVQMVPVAMLNEDAYYHVLRAPRLQSWTLQKLGHAWPQGAWPRRRPQDTLKLVFGSIFHCEGRYGSAALLAEAFCGGFRALCDPNLKEEEFQVKAVETL